MERLRALGYEPVLSPHALDRGPLYYAGALEHRLADLHAAFADPAIDGIVCTRGGWGSAELLPHLDAALIRAHPKAFVGYSDQSSLQTWLANEAGLVTFYGPMVAADFARVDGMDEPSWRSSVEGSESWSLTARDGLRVLRTGTAEGRLHGGCLSILTESLGTPYALRSNGGVLFLEDIGVKPYQWDRMLVHLRYAGLLEQVQGIVFGDMSQGVAPPEQELLERAILHALRDFSGPIAIGLRCGHVDAPNITLPLGVRTRLDCSDGENPRMDFLEAAVTL
jgi:muramoyltetrapeptide carboxypeptidase